jgi:predicted regulator of Ras-like GTPase activity (Roadblock/LC7/MglB family)
MSTLPQLIEEDILQIDRALGELLEKTESSAAMVIDRGGFLITSCGDSRQFDLTTIAALASGAYMANQTIANMVRETSFNSIYQQGETHSMLVVCVDKHCLLVVIFKARISVGAVKYFSRTTVEKIARRLRTAQERDPGAGVDLSMLNVADTRDVFKKKTARPKPE